jgi:uncharacterized membrane protein YtjA (UPF0391 family)
MLLECACAKEHGIAGKWNSACSDMGRYSDMLWALAFLLIALLAAILGFGAAAITFAAIAKFLFYAAVVLFVVTLIGRFMRHV